MKNKIQTLLIISFLTFVVSCKNSNNEINLELEKFDNSLDSLIVEKKNIQSKYLLFLDDTLKGNPKLIDETYYEILNNDSLKIEANCHNYRFKNNELYIHSSEDILGKKFVQKMIYFYDKIDNNLLNTLREKNKDTTYIGYLKKYNSKGDLIKFIIANKWNEININGQLENNENRLLEVYKYDNVNNTKKTWRKEYFNLKYNIDSIKNRKTSSFITKNKEKINTFFKYSYVYDQKGNWVIKKRIKDKNHEVYYRKIIY
ncbi:hypothetical protein [Flavobacterium psychrophilum]|uniref:Lipoprotein n=1 Tax=Flavobacterium psychrophilum TaxID=96345 RepID=A0A7U2RAA8_FLAPS|nr:hypothetical protein [Flavobacterium psychrophilum]EKT4520751.1 hypothetical protein [Flavobacterium psychrophilum]ELM3645161.1 hypothetical protein [Flavobacterium psychrophilum]OAE90420.1 hypothetical protein SU65_11815 [Flavobacterium psychrophilum]OJH11183.1 hypothetical protein FPG87_13080 [Flavobacterium psychrophilum]OUD23241.1 hypothetical protein FPG92_13090 [Flavobacterium psychrophilum]